jgi:hypothetical protein
MAAHARYADIKRWAEATGRRSIQLWMPRETVTAMDRLCRERGVKRAELLSSLINEARGGNGTSADAETAQSLLS